IQNHYSFVRFAIAILFYTGTLSGAYETTNMEYLYDPTTKLCFSFLADDGDESMLEVYGLSTWVSNLTEKRISMATLANLYTIIGL
ncbi:hypothetical protein AAH056_09825, partial [Bacteroides thetaiotaomicron]